MQIAYHQVEIFGFMATWLGMPRVTPLTLRLERAIGGAAQALDALLLRSHDGGAHTCGGLGAWHGGQGAHIHRPRGCWGVARPRLLRGSN